MTDSERVPVSSTELIFRDDDSEVWCGSCLEEQTVIDVLGPGGVDSTQIDLLCMDAPFSKKTHSGHDKDRFTVDNNRKKIDYPYWTVTDVEGFCDLWLPRCVGWTVSITDHVLWQSWTDSFERHGRLTFAPLPLVETGSRVRQQGDGPSGWSCWLAVSRPRNSEFVRWGTLPGAYVQTSQRHKSRIVGGKPLGSMLEIVRDYSKPGDTVCDPTLGGGTTLIAARVAGRIGIGVELDRGRAKLAATEIAKTRHQPTLFGERAMKTAVIKEPSLFEEDRNHVE